MRLVRLCFLALAILTGALALTASANAEPYVYQGGEEGHGPGNLFVGEGEETTELPFYGQSPSLAPDGRRIAFVDNENNIDITDLDGHGPHQILPNSVELFSSLEWAPNGSGLIATSDAIATEGTIVFLHSSSTSTEWEVETILGWNNKPTFEPTISPDGSKIAFMSHFNAEGKNLGGPAIFIANRNGTGVEQLTSTSSVAALNPTFSPNRKKIAFDGEPKGASATEILSVNVETKEVTNLTNTASFWESDADYLSSGRVAYSNGVTGFSVMDANGENKESIKGFSGKETWFQVSWPQTQGDLPSLGPETKEEATQLLHRYSPKLRLDSTEGFYDMSWKPITELYEGETTTESNRLIRSEAEGSAVIAYANPKLGEPNLNSTFLRPSGSKYPNEKLVSGGDRLSERTSSGEAAFEDIVGREALPEYKERTYGRVKYSGGRWWLQYWLWYYYQPAWEGFGDHEGDWEMIQIALNEDGLPELATYAQHSGGESCLWEELPTSIGYYGNLAPDVFVSWGLHASYTSAEAVPATEFTDAEVPVPARVEDMNDSEHWVQWPGTWGDSETSPSAPSTQGSKWSEPTEFYEESGECKASLLAPHRAALRKASPPPIQLRAQRVGDVVKVTYHWSADSKPRPKSMIVALSEPGGIPYSEDVQVHGNSGQVRIGIPFEGEQLVVRAKTIASGVESPTAETPVR